jgi:hypothetical protein
MMEHLFEPAVICELCDYAGADGETQSAMIQIASRIAANSEWRAMAQRAFDAVYGEPRRPLPEGEVGAAFGDDTALFALWLSLHAVQTIRASQRARGIPEAVTRASCDHPAVAVQRYRKQHAGGIGMDYWLLGWCSYIFDGRLYRIGRLHFVPQKSELPIHVYRHRTSRRMLALSAGGSRFDTQGFCANDESPGAWTASFIEDDIAAAGNPIDPRGFARNEIVRLPKADWENVFGPHDAVLEVHIPDRAPFTLDVLRDSFVQARDFFAQHLPEHRHKAFTCESWLFNTQLQDMLGAQSNLAQFQRQGYLVPMPAELAFILYFIFGRRQIDPRTAPRDTRLRRAVLDALDAGVTLRGGGFFLLPQDVDRFGSEPYREQDL